MHSFDAPQDVLLPPHLVSRARAYATEVHATLDYADSNQRSRKVRGDHHSGKLGEEAVRLVYASFGVPVEGPDYTIYTGRRKSWEADLTVDGAALHVKTQTSRASLLYGLSWLFQDSSARSDTALKQLEEWVCFVLLDEEKLRARVFPPQQMKSLKFSEPALAHLQGKKRVAYAREQRWFESEWVALP
ncbi:MAG: hypothetical protein HC933_12930 [Pleurocapsa sp. SU_196_0]|nr:hypothetical protein [Pleurocapsa sp. SU_196_0]